MDICQNEINEVEEKIPADQQSKMLCNVIVRATHELHVKQQKTRSEIQRFLKNDCQQLDNSELVGQVKKDFKEFKKKLNL
jgi:hypothetical protein